MFLTQPDPSPYDLRFRLLGIPVRVHPHFWLMAVIFGFPSERGPMLFAILFIWIAAVFVSVLVHEMGHVLMGRLFGSDGAIVLYGLGGLASGLSGVSRRWQRVLVLLGGVFAQWVLLAAVVLVLFATPSRELPEGLDALLERDRSLIDRVTFRLALAPYSPLLKRLVFDLLAINFFWPLFNLLPVWPLDGGQISRELFEGAMGARGVRVALGISMLTAALVAINAALVATEHQPLLPVVGGWFACGWFTVLLFGLLAAQSWQTLQAFDAQRRWSDDHWDRWER